MSTLPEFVEVGDRIYEVGLFAGPLSHGGRYGRSLVDHDEQRILISDEVKEEDRPMILEKAVSAAQGLGSDAFQPVPVLGSIS